MHSPKMEPRGPWHTQYGQITEGMFVTVVNIPCHGSARLHHDQSFHSTRS